ncbi:MAG: dephospho-CoA kinase [Oscillospiraceae bacterium]|nr:dephospho-CoA kinase [Oscillospiraceae bacterium]
MFIIGITGPSGAGKTTALEAAENLGALALDCDEIYRTLLETNNDMIKQIILQFPDVRANGVSDRIDKAKLRKRVLGNTQALDKLGEITHKFVTEVLDEKISEFEKQGGRAAAIDAYALIESGVGKRCDIIVSVLAPREIRAQRIMKRDGLTPCEALSRINSQKQDDFYISGSDRVFINDYSKAEDFKKICTEYFKSVV